MIRFLVFPTITDHLMVPTLLLLKSIQILREVKMSPYCVNLLLSTLWIFCGKAAASIIFCLHHIAYLRPAVSPLTPSSELLSFL